MLGSLENTFSMLYNLRRQLRREYRGSFLQFRGEELIGGNIIFTVAE